MLRVEGTVLEVASEWRGRPGDEFEQTTVKVLTGKADIERVTLGRDFVVVPEGKDAPPSKQATPREGDEVCMDVILRAYAGRNGAGVNITALRHTPATLVPA